MRYLPHTPAEIEEMLSVIGVSNLDELFSSVPERARFEGALDIAPGLAEPHLMTHMQELADANQGARMLSFLGAGCYAHHIPPAVDQLLLRSEFYTAYTPYQPEVAQGTLQAIFEFQTIVSEIFGLPIANASMYDGASAVAEGAQMARRLTRRNKLLVSECIHPDYRDVLRTYLQGQDSAELISVPLGSDGLRDHAALQGLLSKEVAACIVGYPNFHGQVEDLRGLATAAHECGALVVSSTTEPYALGVIESPGAMGVDIATGEGQALATTPNFGGPNVGLFSCRDDRKYLQQLPGRICGETVDQDGARGYVLTLATREQHIRRERATSNICTNQGLIALALTIRVSLLGKSGFVEAARACLSKTEFLKGLLSDIPGLKVASPGPTFNEFIIDTGTFSAAELCAKAAAENILPGVDLARFKGEKTNHLLCSVTEVHTRAQLERLASVLRRAAA